MNSAPPSLACRRSSPGISRRHGTHHVAHRFNSTTHPRKSASDAACPSPSTKPRSGSRLDSDKSMTAIDQAFRGSGDAPVDRLLRIEIVRGAVVLVVHCMETARRVGRPLVVIESMLLIEQLLLNPLQQRMLLAAGDAPG